MKLNDVLNYKEQHLITKLIVRVISSSFNCIIDLEFQMLVPFLAGTRTSTSPSTNTKTFQLHKLLLHHHHHTFLKCTLQRQEAQLMLTTGSTRF